NGAEQRRAARAQLVVLEASAARAVRTMHVEFGVDVDIRRQQHVDDLHAGHRRTSITAARLTAACSCSGSTTAALAFACATTCAPLPLSTAPAAESTASAATGSVTDLHIDCNVESGASPPIPNMWVGTLLQKKLGDIVVAVVDRVHQRRYG